MPCYFSVAWDAVGRLYGSELRALFESAMGKGKHKKPTAPMRGCVRGVGGGGDLMRVGYYACCGKTNDITPFTTDHVWVMLCLPSTLFTVCPRSSPRSVLARTSYTDRWIHVVILSRGDGCWALLLTGNLNSFFQRDSSNQHACKSHMSMTDDYRSLHVPGVLSAGSL
jgi:hypothetical protein